MPPRKNPLKVVTEADAKAIRKDPPKTLVEATELSERDLLVMMRVRVATEIDSGVPAHALAPLMRQLRDLDKELRLHDQSAKQEAIENAGPAADEAWDAEAI
ncbi:hypothetical protein [Arthrobacter sp. NA-172]|uniref:hypothetical protein n=1 Tax=Arthrobacter sp. NA-172 TaxID=3367524 RepID=UPI0037543B6F